MGIRIFTYSRLRELESFLESVETPSHCELCPGLKGGLHHPSYEVTSKCNLNCIFCYAKSTELAKKLPKPGYYGEEKPKVITVSQYGEPTLIGLDKLEKLFNLLKKRFGKVRIDLQTNGVLLSRRVNADIVMISLSASNRKSYEFLTGRDEFLNVLNAIEVSSEGKTIVRTVYIPGVNENEIEEIAKIAEKYNAEHMIQPCSIHPGMEKLRKIYDFERDTLYDFLDIAEKANYISDVRIPGCLVQIVKDMMEQFDFEEIAFARRKPSERVPEIRRERMFSFNL